MLSIRLDPSIERKLAALAARTGRSKAYYARKAIEELLEDMEDFYLASERLPEAEGKLWTLEELEAEFDKR